jgi:hypothetical protein
MTLGRAPALFKKIPPTYSGVFYIQQKPSRISLQILLGLFYNDHASRDSTDGCEAYAGRRKILKNAKLSRSFSLVGILSF